MSYLYTVPGLYPGHTVRGTGSPRNSQTRDAWERHSPKYDKVLPSLNPTKRTSRCHCWSDSIWERPRPPSSHP